MSKQIHCVYSVASWKCTKHYQQTQDNYLLSLRYKVSWKPNMPLAIVTATFIASSQMFSFLATTIEECLLTQMHLSMSFRVTGTNPNPIILPGPLWIVYSYYCEAWLKQNVQFFTTYTSVRSVSYSCQPWHRKAFACFNCPLSLVLLQKVG